MTILFQSVFRSLQHHPTSLDEWNKSRKKKHDIAGYFFPYFIAYPSTNSIFFLKLSICRSFPVTFALRMQKYIHEENLVLLVIFFVFVTGLTDISLLRLSRLRRTVLVQWIATTEICSFVIVNIRSRKDTSRLKQSHKLYLKKGQSYLVSFIHIYCPVAIGIFRVPLWVFWGNYFTSSATEMYVITDN